MKAFISLEQIEKQIKGEYDLHPVAIGTLNEIKRKVQFGDELSKYLKDKAFDFGIVQAIYSGDTYTVYGIITSELENIHFDITRNSRMFDLGNEYYHIDYVYESDLDKPENKYYTL